ncbi:LacI family transcriptional regulator [Betaproteobacteria bacterium]|nr:LacI family transcriptional regulator [Betaproteobacteria bacterium]
MTIYDIAAKAQVSISTISRVLNDPDKVNKNTRKRVLAVLEKYNYTPNAMARGLVRNSMRTIGVIVADIRNMNLSQIAYTIENHFFNWGFSVLLCNTSNKLEKKKDYLRILAERKVDGVIFVGSAFADINIERDIKRYLHSTPVVVTNGIINLPQAHSVRMDHNFGMELAVGHLKERGHRDIMLIRNSRSYNSANKVKGFHHAMKTFNLTTDDNHVIESSDGYKGGIEAVNMMMESGEKPSALIFCDDASALAGMLQLQDKGYVIPRDMAIIGYEQSDHSILARPQLTSLSMKIATFSSIAANTLHDILLDKEVGTAINLCPELIVRHST